jgi:hypothetical protein
MSVTDVVMWIEIACFAASIVVSVVLSVRNLYLKLPSFDRLSPAILQAVLFVPSLFAGANGHGHPTELFVPMIVTSVWSLLAFVSAYRLYHLHVGTTPILAFSQFIQAIGIVFLAVLDYVNGCYFYYGRFVWNP